MERNEHVTRFLHTGDWQLGMTRHFFSEGVQERFAQSRFDAIRELGRIAEEEDCRFIVVCGDVFGDDSRLFEPGEKEVRNSAIAMAMRRIAMCEQAGTGMRMIGRKLIQDSKFKIEGLDMTKIEKFEDIEAWQKGRAIGTLVRK